jgi:hypothetical protein
MPSRPPLTVFEWGALGAWAADVLGEQRLVAFLRFGEVGEEAMLLLFNGSQQGLTLFELADSQLALLHEDITMSNPNTQVEHAGGSSQDAAGSATAWAPPSNNLEVNPTAPQLRMDQLSAVKGKAGGSSFNVHAQHLQQPTMRWLYFFCPVCSWQLGVSVFSTPLHRMGASTTRCTHCLAFLSLNGDWAWLNGNFSVALPHTSNPPTVSVLSPPRGA